MGRRRNDNTLNLFAFQDIITGVAGVMLFILLLLVVQLTLRTAIASTEVLQESSSAAPMEMRPVDSGERLQQLQEQLQAMRQQGAELLRADGTKLDARIAAAEKELDDLMDANESQKTAAQTLESQLASNETSEERKATLKKKSELQSKLEELEEEQTRHAGGKLVAFNAESSGVRDLWIVDMRGTSAAIFDVRSPQAAQTVTYGRFDPAMKTAMVIRSRLAELTKSRNVVVLLRPSVAGSGPDLLDAFRSAGFRVALELLDEETQVTAPSEVP
ncbi:MAG: hypothetical protein AB8B91_12505 [Rubripirellula sp.]